MFDIEIRRTFSAAHQLKGYDGDCRNLHGHNYNVIAVVRTAKLNEIGIALDFKSPDGESIEVSIGRYDEKTGEVTIDPISKILTSKGIAKTGQTFRINERVNPTQMEGFLGNILEKVGEFLRGSFKMFLDSFNK